jgi:DNA transposition AAA+ family ATPase
VRTHFVRTENLDRLEQGLLAISERGAREAAWMLVTGRPGEGKTTTLYHWGAAAGACFITMQQGDTPGKLLTALADRLGVPQSKGFENAIGARLAAGQIPVVLDEAGFALTENAACLERLRGLTDKSGTPVILVAMAQDVWKFGQHQQIASRIYTWVEFKPSSLNDVAAACSQLTDVQIDGDLIRRIHAETEGRMRSVLNAISRIEGAARGLGKTQIGAADVKGVTLCEDYRQGRGAAIKSARRSA